MNPADESFPDEPFDSLLAAYHEAVAAGLTPPGEDSTPGLPPEQVARLRKAAAVLDLLEEDRRCTPAPGGLDAVLLRQGLPAAPSGGKPFGRFRVVRELGRGGF